MDEALHPAVTDIQPTVQSVEEPVKTNDKQQSYVQEGLKVEIKKGKVTFKEQRLPVERHPETIREWNEFHIKRHIHPSETISSHFHGLIAKFIQDSSLALLQLSKELRTILYSSDFGLDTDAATEADLVKVVETLAEYTNYGLEKDTAGLKNAAYFVWDVKDKSLLGSLRPFFEERVASRIKAKSWLETILGISGSTVTAVDKIPVEPNSNESTPKKLPLENTPNGKKLSESLATGGRKKGTASKSSTIKSSTKISRQEDKSQTSLSNFLISRKKEPSQIEGEEELSQLSNFHSRFLPFHVRQDVTLASHNVFNKRMDVADSMSQDLDSLKSEFFLFCSNAKRQRNCSNLAASSSRRKNWKFLKYSEDYRPPYFGTLGKKAPKLSARCPQKQDPHNISYDVDSEDEWEEEEPGEELMSEDEEEPVEEEDVDEQDDFVVQDDAVDGAKKKKRAAVLVPIIIFPWTQESARDMFKEYDRCWFSEKLFIDPFQTMNPEPVNDKVNGVFKTQEDFATFLMTIDTATGPKAKILEMAKERLPYLSKSAIELQLKEVAVREAIGVEKKKWRIKDDYSSHLPSLLSKKRKTPFTVNSE